MLLVVGLGCFFAGMATVVLLVMVTIATLSKQWIDSDTEMTDWSQIGDIPH